jgi:hypothetical protein
MPDWKCFHFSDRSQAVADRLPAKSHNTVQHRVTLQAAPQASQAPSGQPLRQISALPEQDAGRSNNPTFRRAGRLPLSDDADLLKWALALRKPGTGWAGIP